MRRCIWIAPALLAVTAIGLRAQAPNPVVLDPTVTLQRRAGKATAQFEADISAAELKARLSIETASEERRLGLANAAHERAASMWLAAEAYRQSAKDPQARGGYIQAVAQATSQHQQTQSQVFQTWAQANGTMVQTVNQEGTAGLQTANQELSAALQSFGQAMPNFDKELAAEAAEEGTPARAEAPDSQKALDASLKAARDKYRAALQEATAAWAQQTGQTLAQLRNRQVADELAGNQLRKANRFWSGTGTDALEELRASFRSALRKYQLAGQQD